MTIPDVIAAWSDIDARLARHRDDLWILGIRAALLRAEARRLSRRSRWEARRARWQLQRHFVRGTTVASAPKERPVRRRSRGRFVVVR